MTFTILFDTVSVFILVFGIFATYIPRRQYLALLTTTVALFAVNSFVYNYGYGVIFEWEYQPPSFQLLLAGVLRHAQSYGMLAAIMIGKQFFDIQRQYFVLEKEKRENELKMLKSQIDPHFLFNNLNILDVLIERDPAAARIYLNHLASLYRYLIRHKDEEVVSLHDEWAFAKDYIYLLQQRFGGVFKFELQGNATDLNSFFIPPGAMQTVIENVVKHNQGDDEHPILVSVLLKDNAILVSNTLRPKLDSTESNGTGLANLRARYRLLVDQAPDIRRDNGNFVVRLPLIRSIKA
ncbi:MAG: histidine kinase [Saprospiraceae bacterium]|nr:histidine kinase [Saprospiraceae bacterium]